jgi:pilus assembly protein Flp/PilA
MSIFLTPIEIITPWGTTKDRGKAMGITILKRVLRDQKGATAIEYGLIVALIVVGIMASLNALAGTVVDMWNMISQQYLAVS